VNRLVVAVAAALVVGAGAAFATGLGPAPGDDAGAEGTGFPTATSTPAPDTGGVSVADVSSSDTSDATATPEPRPAFTTTVDAIKECGRTCRDVTSTVSNDGRAPATGVTVSIRIFVGQEASGDVVWQASEDVGRLAVNDSSTATKRVELSLAEAVAVRGADGWITVQTTIQSDQRTVTFAESRQVA
jgi:hypothetical protein